MTRTWRHKLIAAWFVATAAGLAVSCNQNPQPLPPGGDFGAPGGSSGGGGTSSGAFGGGSSGGGSSSGGLLLSDGGSYGFDDGGATPKYDGGTGEDAAVPPATDGSADAGPDASADGPVESVDGACGGAEAGDDVMPSVCADGGTGE